jgi:methionyl-tRNA formyltransferase
MGWRIIEWPQLVERVGSSASPDLGADLGISAWWPRIIRGPLLDWPREGWINLHPSLLPFNRGKHPNFWSLVEETPAGASIHFVDESIDGGDIISQAQIEVSWVDTGETIHRRTKQLCVQLFADLAAAIVDGEPLPRQAQPPPPTPVHFARELDPASEIGLDDVYTARKLLNLLRARTFPPHPGISFRDAGRRFTVRISIERADDE